MLISSKPDISVNASRAKNEENESFILSWLIFGFMTNLILKGFRHTLQEDDLWELDETDECEKNYNAFRGHMDVEMRRWKYAFFEFCLLESY